MSKSAFGVELGKGFRLGQPAKKAAESAAVHLDFKPIKPGVKPVGPGSLRRVMDPGAHETQLAAERRRKLGKSAFGVEAAVRAPAAVGRLKPVPPAASVKVRPRKLDTAIAATGGGTD